MKKRYFCLIVALVLALSACTNQSSVNSVEEKEPTTRVVGERCDIYLMVLDRMWSELPANKDIVYFALDLSGVTDLMPEDKTFVIQTFAEKYGIEVLVNTWEELRCQGYFTPDKEMDGDYFWPDGIYFSITGSIRTFNACAWRGPQGTRWLMDCYVIRNRDGSWDLDIGAMALAG